MARRENEGKARLRERSDEENVTRGKSSDKGRWVEGEVVLKGRRERKK